MKATELRVGNYITSKEWGGYHQIIGVELIENGYRVQSKGYWHVCIPGVYFDISPIPLDENLLLKCGFEDWTGNQGYYVMLGKVIGYVKITFSFHLPTKTISRAEIGDDINIMHIKYIHQLQNLFFSLTGTELNAQL